MNGGGSFGLAEALMWAALLAGAGWAMASGWDGWRGHRVRQRTRRLLGGFGDGAGADPGRASPSEPSCNVGKFAESGLGRCVGSDRRVARIQEKWRRASRGIGSGRLREAGAALGVAAFVVVVVGGVAGWILACVGAYGVRWWMRRRRSQEEAAGSQQPGNARAAAEQLPLAAELMAACLAAGSTPAPAADAVGRSLGGPLGALLIRTATELRLGAEPAVAWAHFALLPGSDGFVRSMERAGTAGAPAVDQMARLTAELRIRRVREASARARRAAVLVTGPLGLCFLPAFLAVGVAPVVMGLAGSLL
ncbi:type II secretion system F family protein [Streptomyces marispadix]|uniref:Type II secretion system F family protein n=1 Tax=Streptomyces marispadix TaxID=2922868 RepID=A0ABS9SZR5_9ACTN|nr:type II secretion system F family protein [Streptomyces marispadix]MCH6161777.1 type II secretion system F family protein [Streptomyces marispadix]